VTEKIGSWLNAVENFFSKLTKQRTRRGVFLSGGIHGSDGFAGLTHLWDARYDRSTE
jgi:hypothetical protein